MKLPVNLYSALKKVRPVYYWSFRQALVKSLPVHLRRLEYLPLGLAVSGGADSLALAHLIKTVYCKISPLLFERLVRAFVVDHAARESSADEAWRTAQTLERMGFATSVIRASWPLGVEPQNLTNFETEARSVRYKALGKACYANNINILLVAHHREDQAETLLQRLANNHGQLGLHGIKSASAVPHCRGIYGIDHSGGYFLPQKMRMKNFCAWDPRHSEEVTSVEVGGVTICRPLLGFSKPELMATCFKAGIPWIEDPTNHDATMTSRNAVRVLLRSDQLPKALQTESLLTMRERVVHHQSTRDGQVDATLRERRRHLDLKSGRLAVQFSRRPFVTMEDIPEENRPRAIEDAHMKVVEILWRCLMAVTPLENVRRQDIMPVATHFSPWLHKIVRGDSAPIRDSFTVGGVEATRLDFDQTADAPSAFKIHDGKQPLRESNWSDCWVFCRAPYKRGEDVPTVDFSEPLRDPVGLESVAPFKRMQSTGWSQWRLWDGRYWIRVKIKGGQRLIVRPFLPSDKNEFRLAALPSTFDEKLLHHAPGKVRWTLPAIAICKNAEDTEGRAVALPSLGLRSQVESIAWHIRYRYFDEFGQQILAHRVASTPANRTSFSIG